MTSTAELIEFEYAEIYQRAKRLDASATLEMDKSYGATIRYAGYVDFYAAGQLSAHLKD